MSYKSYPSEMVREGLRLRRLRSGLSQTALGARVGMPQTKIAKLESGRQRLLFDEALLLAEALREPASIAELKGPQWGSSRSR